MDSEQPQDQAAPTSVLDTTKVSKLFDYKNKIDHVLYKYSKNINIAEDLNKDNEGQCKLQEIVMQCISGMEDDRISQKEWVSKVDDAQRLALLVKEPKNTPLPQSANIKYPLITTACYQYAARTYPEIIQDGKVVKIEIIGQDKDGSLAQQGELLSTHMTYQLLVQDSEWEAGVDKMLVVFANIGFVVKKTYFDPLRKKNISELCNYKDVILRNSSDVHHICDLRRITHVLHLHPNDLIEGSRLGIYLEDAVDEIMKSYAQNIINPECDVYEQHCFIDLDEDGYQEPYIVTWHKTTNKLLRIFARYTKDEIQLNHNNEVIRIEPIQYFTAFHFLPSPDGCFMSLGFGTLMLHLNETINTILNQLIDAGTLSNMQTGFIDSRIKVMGGQLLGDPGQWLKVKSVIGQQLKDGVLPISYKEPSHVLYQLLGMLIETAKDLTASTDALQGSMSAQNVPATTMLSLIEQGLKMYSAIQRRLYRSLKEEYHKLYKLNQRYLDPNEYNAIVGPENSVNNNVYQNPSLRIVPIADPNLSSDAQRLSQAQILMPLAGKPGVNTYEVYRRYLQAAKVPNIDAIVPPEKASQAQQPDPKLVQVQQQGQIKQAEVAIKSRHQDLKEKEFAAKLAKTEAEITQMQANAVKLISDASSAQDKSKMQEMGLQLDTIKSKISATMQAHKQLVDQNIADKENALEQQKVQNQHTQAMTQLQQNQQQMQNDQQQQQVENEPQETPDNGVDQTSSNPSPDQSDQGSPPSQ